MAKMAEAKADKALKDIGSPCYRYWQALYLSFYCGRLYVDIGKRWKGLGIGYLFLLVCFAIIPLNLRIVFDKF